MIPAFLLAHDLTIRWVAAWMVPLEATFDMIETELDRQRANVSHGHGTTFRTTAPRPAPAAPKPIYGSPAAAPLTTPGSLDQPSKSKGRGGVHWLLSLLRRRR